jgi:hypothetical protein
LEAFELAPGFWRWTGRRDTIGAEVSSVYYKSGTEILLFDPLLPPEDPDVFWRALDRDVLPGDIVLVVLTARSHTRSAHLIAGRYPGGRVWDEHEAGPLPAGVAAHPSGRASEAVFWIPEHRALVIGDVLVGDGADGLALGRGAGAREIEALRPLVDLEPALVLPSHGEPPVDAASALVAVLGLDG